ncbi:MAG: sugar kinase [Planctomycetota bacterium]|nr:sugar kinase [Planctomycetota bacterium]MEC7428476.1 sugar kinase [Planctomycetota bacterium]MEC8782181.1 sugar kinase [Planctomycetota bacterium]MEE3075767.1 sugar kinase [Planctomycetota bacterium]
MGCVVTLGEIMLRLATPRRARFQQAMPGGIDVTFAGAEASIAASFSYLGGTSRFVSALPTHAVADACLADLRGLGVDVSHVVRSDVGRLGVYYLESGANQRPGQVIYDRENSTISRLPPEAYPWESAFQGADWLVLSGITPAISRQAAEVGRRAIAEARSRGVRVALDMNYRAKLWKWEASMSARQLAIQVMRQWLPEVQLFICGIEDLVEILDEDVPKETVDLDFAFIENIRKSFPGLESLALSRRGAGSASQQTYGGTFCDLRLAEIWHAPVEEGRPGFYSITEMVDRLGAGDAFTAGLLFALSHPELSEGQTALSFATAAGCLAHSIEGDFNYSTREEIERLMNEGSSGRVQR